MDQTNLSGVVRELGQNLHSGAVAKKGPVATGTQRLVPTKPNQAVEVSMSLRTVRILPGVTWVAFFNDPAPSPGIFPTGTDDCSRSPRQTDMNGDSSLLQGKAGYSGQGFFDSDFDLFDLQFRPEHRAFLETLDKELSKAD